MVAKFALRPRLFMLLAKKTSSARSLAPPLQIEPASLGFDLVLGANQEAAAYIVMIVWLVASDLCLRRAFSFSRSAHCVQIGLAFLKQQMYNVSKINTGELVVQAERKSSNFDPLT